MTEDLSKIHSYLPRLVEQLKSGRVERREFLRTATLLGLSVGAAYGLAGLPLSIATAGRAKAASGGTVRMSHRLPPIDSPHTLTEVFITNVARQCLDYLTRTDSDNITHPWLLEKWETSEDLKTWDLHLKKGIKWSNGDELVADDVIWNIKRWLDPSTGSSILGLMKAYMMDAEAKAIWDANAIEKVDDHHVRLNCRSPQLGVPEHLFHYQAFILHPSENGKWGAGGLCTGPFSLTEHVVGKRAVVTRREDYWGEPAKLDSVEFIDLGDDPAAEVAALASGQVDGLFEGSTAQHAVLKKLPNMVIHSVPTAQTAVARMQMIHKPWDDARVRKAMRLALDTEKLLQIAHLGLGLPGEHHHVAAVHPEYAKGHALKQDVEGAKKLLAEAGYSDGFDSEIFCKQDPDWEPIAVQAMVEMWKAIGARIKINVLPSAQYWDIWDQETAPLAFTPWTHRPLGIMTMALAYRTGVPWNESKYSNPRLDELITKAEGLVDVEQRREVMAEIEQLMNEEGPVCIPLWRAVFTAVHERVKGYKAHPTSYIFCEQWSVEA